MPQTSSTTPVQMAVLYFAIMAMGMGQTVVFAIVPMLGRELALDQIVLQLPGTDWSFAMRELAITSLTSLASLTYFVAAPFWGRRSDMIGRKPVIIIGLVGYFIGTLAFNGVAHLGLWGVASGLFLWALLMLSRVLLVAVMAATQPAATAYVVDVTPIETRTKGMSRLSAANQIGTMVGPALAYFAGISFLAPLYIQATICVVAALLVWRFLAPVQHLSASRQRSKKLSYLDPRIRIFLAVGLVMFTMMGMVQQTLGFYFQDKLQLDGVAAAQQFSKAMVVSSIMMLVSQFAIVQRWRGHPVGLLKYGLPVAAAGYVCMALASSMSLLMAGMALFGLGMGMATPGYSVTATYAVSPQEQGALAGLSASAPAMGFVIGPIVGGLIYGYQASLTYWVAAAVLIPLAVYCAFLKPNHESAAKL